jgi:1-acyl-sn-glycerol-3-phosphate acyltransferase
MGYSKQRFYHLLRGLLTPVLKRLIQIEVVGLENLPTPGTPAVLVSNHRSDIDPAVIGAAIPRYIAWMAADYIRKVPITGWLAQRTGMVLINLEGALTRSALKQTFQVLTDGGWLGIFPEGEDYIFTNDFSAPMARFYPGFAVIAHKRKVPIVPVVLYPVAESLYPLPVPAAIHEDVAKRCDLSQPKQIVRYRSVKVVIGKPIPPVAETRETAIPQLQAQTRERLEQLQRQAASTLSAAR